MKSYFSKKVYVFLLLAPLASLTVFGQAANPSYSSYSGQPTLSGTQSVRLLPGFHAPAGSTLRVFIAGSTDLGGGGTGTQNYVQKTTYLKAGAGGALTTLDAMRDITYYDGLGRPLQEVQVKASGGDGYKDVVVPLVYDAYGRQDKRYLPYATATGAGGAFKSGAIAAQATFYNSPPSGVVQIPVWGSFTPSYAKTVFESSPLDRLTEQGFEGSAWQPTGSRGINSRRTVLTEHTVNNTVAFSSTSTTYQVARYGVSLASDGTPTLTLDNVYAARELQVTVTKDENWTSANGRAGTYEEYVDKQGRTVLKRTFNKKPDNSLEMLSTYYVYDDRGNVAFVLPPGSNPDTGTLMSSTVLNQYCYQYHYDGKGRLVAKHSPGDDPAKWENMIYNPVGMIMHQELRQYTETYTGFGPGPYHHFFKYDAQGRVVIKGIEKNRTETRAVIQATVDAQSTYTPQWEERSTASGNLHGYTNRAIPQNDLNFDVTEVNYYDDYTIPGLPWTVSTAYSKLTQGLLTARKVKVLGTSTYLWTLYYYDDKGNVVRSLSQHYQGGAYSVNKFDDVTNTYNFTGQLTQSVRKHHAGSATVPALTVTTEYTYDHRGRLLDTKKKVDATAMTILSRNGYNEVGQIISKGQYSINLASPSFSHAISYKYNPRGWLSEINSPLFKEVLQYNEGSSKQYNGNIAYQLFTRKNLSNTLVTETYSYAYDAINRLTSGTMAGGKGKEEVTYDKMGNILSLKRTNPAAALIDQLTYTYTGNRLTKVVDANANVSGDYQLPGTTNYTYDANGSLKSRLNTASTANNISAVTYNYLNLPQTVTATSGNVTYTYAADGRKLRSVNGIQGQTRDYVDGIEYVDGTLELVHTEEGRVVKSGTAFRYDYVLKDHLGNGRVGFHAVTGSVASVPNFTADYYPFGLKYLADARAGSPKNNYLYNNKELQDGLKLYDYGARFYDPVIGRWGSVDPLAEKYYSSSPFNYVDNNPVLRIDPNGMDWIVSTRKDEDGNTQINLTYYTAVMNSSGKDIDMANFMSNQVSEFANVFGQGNVNAKLLIRQVSSADELNDFESLIDIQAGSNFKKNKDGSFVGGAATIGGKFVRLNADNINSDGGLIDKATAIHEIGHTGGLIHTFEPNTKANFPNGKPVPTNLQQFFNVTNDPYYEANFMNYTSVAEKSGTLNPNINARKFFQNTVGKATSGQIQAIINNLYNGNLNYNNIPKRR